MRPDTYRAVQLHIGEITLAKLKSESTELANVGGAALDVSRDIRNAGIEVVGAKDNIAVNEVTATQMMEILETASSAEEATQLLHKLAGLIPFADKRALALDGTSFTVTRLVIREKGGFSKKDDVAALIRTQHGDLQVLTFEQNEGRNQFVAGLHRIVTKFGEAPNWSLQVYGSDDAIAALLSGQRPDEGEKYFYAMVPTPFWRGYGDTYTQQEAVEAEYTQV